MFGYEPYQVEDFVLDPRFRRWVLAPAPPEDAAWEAWLREHPGKRQAVEQARQIVLALRAATAAGTRGAGAGRGGDGAERTHQRFGPAAAGEPARPEHRDPATEGRVRYARSFTGGRREVFLEGEAFFEVTKNPHQPFLVYAGKLVTKVLGTSFHVAANPRDAHVTVRVKTGRVSLFTDTTAAPALVLAPNEQAVYRTADARMEKAYSIPITYEADALKGCNITASFTDEPFAVKLDLICRTIGVTYRIEADRAVITGKGCGQ